MLGLFVSHHGLTQARDIVGFALLMSESTGTQRTFPVNVNVMDFLHLKWLDKSRLSSLVRMPSFEVVLFAIVEILSSDRDFAVKANPFNDSALSLRLRHATALLEVSA